MTKYYLPCRCHYNKFWKVVCLEYGGNILDRTNTIDFQTFEYETLTPIPKFEVSTVTFDEHCDRRADELFQKSLERDCKINLMWSGGVDSTTALVAFLRHPRAHERLNIVMSKKSIGEYPSFYFNFIKDKLRHAIVEDPKTQLSALDINITGEIGDQLFGSAAILEAAKYGRLEIPFRDYFSRRFLDEMEPQILHSPVEIKTVFDMMWWMNFSLKFQNVQLRIYPSVMMSYGSITHFFETDYFQIWSMNNHDKKIKGSDMKSYKYIAKDYIYSLTKDSLYRDHKMKVGSLRIGPTRLSIDTDFKFKVC